MQTPDPETKAESPPTVGNVLTALVESNRALVKGLREEGITDDERLDRLEEIATTNLQNITALAMLFQENAIALDEQFTLYGTAINTHAAEMMDHRERLTKLENPKRIITLG